MAEGTARLAPALLDRLNPFQPLLEQLGLGIAQITPDGKWVTASQRLCEMLGYTPGELLKEPLDKFLPLPPTTTNPRSRADQPSSGATGSAVENWVIRRDGVPIRLRTACSAIRDDNSGETRGFLVLVHELFQGEAAGRESPEFAGRLLKAQEEERSRIARELHDDIGQSLAILAVQLQRAGRPVSGEPGQSHPDASKLYAKAQAIAERVGRLSHQLYSRKLEFLGLAQTVRGECREFSRAQKITVQCVCDEIPRELDGSVGLCVLRVVQEALHNIQKHSRATQVTVGLTGDAREVKLAISDNGVGFDVEQARLSLGIGLMGMRERIQLVRGEFEILPKPGEGTRILVRVPYAAADPPSL